MAAESLPSKVPTPDTTPASSSLLYIVDDPYGTPADNATTLANGVTKGHGLADGVVKVSSGTMTPATAGTDYYNPGGTDVAVADGGTGASTAAGARTNLGAVNIAGDTITDGSGNFIDLDPEGNTGAGDPLIKLRGEAFPYVILEDAASNANFTQIAHDIANNYGYGAHAAIYENSAGKHAFVNDVIVPDEAYDATGWNGNNEVPTKNAVRDKIEDILDGVTFSGDISVPDEAYDATNWNGSLEVPTKNAIRDKFETLSAGGQTVVTRIVAASGGDHTTLQAALSAASAGDTIYVRAGTYALAANTTSTLANIRIVGENPQTSIINLATFTLTLSGNNVSFENLKVIGDSASTGNVVLSGTDVVAKDCWLYSSNTTNIFFTASGARSKVHDNLFECTATTVQQILRVTGNNASIRNNFFKLAGNSNSSSIGVIDLQLTGCHFVGNTVITSNGVSSSGNPLLEISGDQMNIVGNTFIDTSARSKVIFLGTSAVNCNVNGNYVYNAFTSIWVDSGAVRNNINGNYVYTWSSSGFAIDINANENNIINNYCYNSSTSGNAIRITGQDYNNVVGNYCLGGQYGIRLTSGSDFGNVTGNYLKPSNTSGAYGIYLDSADFVSVSGNNCIMPNNTTGRGIFVQGDANTISGNYIYQGNYGIEQGATSNNNNIFSGNVIQEAGNGIEVEGQDSIYTNNNFYIISTSDFVYTTADGANIIKNNIGDDISILDEHMFVNMKNTSGSSVAAGDVVTYKSVAAGNEFTTTTSAGDAKVLGMALETIANNATGSIKILGKTTVLKVNGTTDIAIGDFLSTFTSAGIAAKASAGQTAFAIALEAYTTDDSNGVIDALIITPRLI